MTIYGLHRTLGLEVPSRGPPNSLEASAKVELDVFVQNGCDLHRTLPRRRTDNGWR